MILSPVPTLRQKKGTEKLDPISCAHTEAKEWAQAELAWFTTALRYGPCTQFINVSHRTLHIYWQFSAMSHAIHKIVSKRRCQSYFSSRRSPHHGISKDSDLCASAHRCPHYAYARLIARVTLKLLQVGVDQFPGCLCSVAQSPYCHTTDILRGHHVQLHGDGFRILQPDLVGSIT